MKGETFTSRYTRLGGSVIIAITIGAILFQQDPHQPHSVAISPLIRLVNLIDRWRHSTPFYAVLRHFTPLPCNVAKLCE